LITYQRVLGFERFPWSILWQTKIFKQVLGERKKIRWTDLGLVKKDKQLDERKSCSFFAKPQKQIRPFYFSSNTW
jgi:hypothetical protein